LALTKNKKENPALAWFFSKYDKIHVILSIFISNFIENS
jgi:hypothetical protein